MNILSIAKNLSESINPKKQEQNDYQKQINNLTLENTKTDISKYDKNQLLPIIEKLEEKNNEQKNEINELNNK